MPTTNSSTQENTGASITDRISDAASQAKDKVADFGRTAAEKIDQNRISAASGLESAASTLHQNAESLPGGEKVSQIAHTAADKLTSTADYVRRHDVNGMMEDVERMVKNNPGPSLFAAAVV